MKINNSIDMANLHMSLPENDFHILSHELSIMPECQYRFCSNFKAYKHNFVISQGTSSYYIGYEYNAERYNNHLHSLKLEYNPNKIAVDRIMRGLLDIGLNNLSLKIKSVDVAYDVDVPFNNFVVDMGTKRQINVYKGTYYIGERSEGIKIYDKQKEAQLKSPMSRYEIRCNVNTDITKFDYKFNDNIVLPSVHIIQTLPIDNFDRCVLLGLMQDSALLSGFTRTKKAYYKLLLENLQTFKPDSKSITLSVRQYRDALIKLISMVA